MGAKKPKYRTFGEIHKVIHDCRREVSNPHGPPLEPTYVDLLEVAEQLLRDNEFLQSSLALYEMVEEANHNTAEFRKAHKP